MAIIEFTKHAGEKLLERGTSQEPAGVAARQQRAPFRRPLGGSREASHALLQYIRLQDGLDVPDDLMVVFDVDEGVVSLEGTAPDEETHELVVLLAGNIEGVQVVHDGMTTACEGRRSQFHIVRPGETAADIARDHYGDERLARKILVANSPIVRYARDVSQGQTIRLPHGVA
jgi:hypothetical protein